MVSRPDTYVWAAEVITIQVEKYNETALRHYDFAFPMLNVDSM